MSERLTFTDRLIEAIREKKSLLAVGLDPQLQYMPRHLKEGAVARLGKSLDAVGSLFRRFNRAVIDAVEPFCIAVKPQIAFYEIYGLAGLRAFSDTIYYARKKGLVVITDAKRGDGGDTAIAYAQGHVGKIPFWGATPDELSEVESPIRADALTVHGYIGSACITPFVKAVLDHGTGIFVVDKTSFKPNSEVEQIEAASGRKVWEELALLVGRWGEGTEGRHGYRNVGVVLGATYPTDAPAMRQILPTSWFLVPGYGKQGGGADGAVAAANQDGLGIVVNSSRGITYAYREEQFKTDPENFAGAAAEAARFAQNDLNEALKRAGKFNF